MATRTHTTRRATARVAFLAISLAAVARAQTLDAQATVLLSGHADPRDGRVYTVVPAYESISLKVTEIELPRIGELKLVVSGWGLIAFGDPRPGEQATGDLDLGYLEGRFFKERVTLRLGRQLIVGGAARVTPLDGISIDARLYRGMGVLVYGGAPVTPRFGLSRGDGAVGARLYWRRSWDTEVGVSAIEVLGQGREARRDFAVDGRWNVVRQLALNGYVLVSLKEQRLGEATLSAAWQPRGNLQLTADWRRVAPDLFLPLNSIFSVFSQETRDEVGATVWWAPLARLRLSADYRFVVEPEGYGHRGGIKASFAFTPSTTAGAEARLLHLAPSGYVQARLFGTQRVRSLFVAVDLDAYFLERAINGQGYSLTGAVTAGWDFHPGWKLVVTGIGDVTPFVDRRFEVLARLVWNHTMRFHEVRP